MKKTKRVPKWLPLWCLVLVLAISLTGKAAPEKSENSWRYEDGQQKGIPQLYAAQNENAWKKVDGKFYNDINQIIEGAVKKGIDVSKWQGTINWEKVKKTDVDFAIIRCGYGGNYTQYDDKYWKRNADECTRLDIPFGTYIYSYATTVEEARSEAEHVLRLVKGYDLDYPIYFDMEDSSTVSAGKSGLAQIAKTFCDTITAAGYDVGIYANKNWWNTYLTDPVFAQWERWVAQYNSQCNYAGDYRIWQCTSTGEVDGIDGDVDINFEFGTWKAEGITADTEAPQPMKKTISFDADILGNTDDLKYKYVWMKNGWKEWGVIRDFSEDSTVQWTPDTGGDYTIYMDVLDSGGKTETVTLKYQIKNWCNSGISSDLEPPQAKNAGISLTTDISGDSEGLQYKYVWMKDNWKSWGVIRQFSDSNTVVWKPEAAGEYTIYADACDADGVIDTTSISYKIIDMSCELETIRVSSDGGMEVGTDIMLSPQLKIVTPNGGREGVQYKYVWMKNGWKEWGVIRDFTDQDETRWIPQSAGLYTLYVDVKDKWGNIETMSCTVQVKAASYSFQGIKADLASPQVCGTGIQIMPNITGNTFGSSFKYVWMKDGWKEWGVIKDFSTDLSVSWYPKTSGTYTIYLDMKSGDGKVTTKTMSYQIIQKSWKAKQPQVNIQGRAEPGVTAWISAGITSLVENADNSSLQYKYVWMKDEWKEWGVIKDFSQQNLVEWIPSREGEYAVYVDVKDTMGNTETVYTKFSVVSATWNYTGIRTEKIPETAEYLIHTETSGNTYGLQYKYVWMKDNWKEWGVIQDFSDKTEICWKPESEGTYYIYVDIKNTAGVVTTKSVELV